MISKEEVLKLIKETSKYSHSLIVSYIMCKFAIKLEGDSETWEIVGLLHDLDIDQVEDNMSKHGIKANEFLKGKLSEDCLYAIKNYDYRTGFKPKSTLDKALIIADSLASIIEGIKEMPLSIERIEAEIERVSVQEPWLRDNLIMCKEIGISKSELLRLTINSLNMSWEGRNQREIV